MSQEYLTTEELAERIKYDTRTIRERLKDSALLEDVVIFRRRQHGKSEAGSTTPVHQYKT